MIRQALISLILIATVAAVAVIVPQFTKRAAPPLASLVAFVESHGTAHKIRPTVTKYFGLPADGDVFRQCAAVSESGRKRSVGIRHGSDADKTDILLTDEHPDGGEVYVYRTSNTGELLNSALIDAEPKPIDDANRRFENEKGFWLNWIREKLKHEAN